MADELEKRADSMHPSTSKYCRVILTEWLTSGKKLTLQEQKQQFPAFKGLTVKDSGFRSPSLHIVDMCISNLCKIMVNPQKSTG